MRTTRRQILAVLLGAPVVAVAMRQSPATTEEMIVTRIRSKAAHRKSAAHVAARAGLHGQSPVALVHRLCPDGAERAHLAACSSAEFDLWLSNTIRSDFADGDINVVDGWMLARSEVLTAAIATA